MRFGAGLKVFSGKTVFLLRVRGAIFFAVGEGARSFFAAGARGAGGGGGGGGGALLLLRVPFFCRGSY